MRRFSAVLVLALMGCDEDPCVQEIEEATRKLVLAQTYEEVRAVYDEADAKPGTSFKLWAAAELWCAEFSELSSGCASEPGTSAIRAALEEQLACLEKR